MNPFSCYFPQFSLYLYCYEVLQPWRILFFNLMKENNTKGSIHNMLDFTFSTGFYIFHKGYFFSENFQWKWWKAIASMYKVHNCDTKYFPKITASFCASTKPKKEPELWVNKKLNSIVFFHSCFSRRKPCKVNQMSSRALQSHWSLSRSPSRLIGWGEGEVEIHHLVS